MKSKKPPQLLGTAPYTLLKTFPYITLSAAADELGISQQRITRLLKILQVPIIKIGTLVLLPPVAITRLQYALDNNEVKRGRKPNAA